MPGEIAEQVLIFVDERLPGGGEPLVESRRVPDGEPGEESGHLVCGCPSWVRVDRETELHHVTLDRTGKLDPVPAGQDHFAGAFADMLERLAQGGPRLGFRRLAPQQPRQLLPGMRAAFQGEEGKQSELLRAERRRDQPPAQGE